MFFAKYMHCADVKKHFVFIVLKSGHVSLLTNDLTNILRNQNQQQKSFFREIAPHFLVHIYAQIIVLKLKTAF